MNCFLVSYFIHNLCIQRNPKIMRIKTIGSSLHDTNPISLLCSSNDKEKTQCLDAKAALGNGTKKYVQKEWRRLLEEYYIFRFKNGTVSPVAYLLWTCQRNHQMRRTFIRKWKKLQVDNLLKANRSLEDPDVKHRFDKVFPLSAVFQPSPKTIQRFLPTRRSDKISPMLHGITKAIVLEK